MARRKKPTARKLAPYAHGRRHRSTRSSPAATPQEVTPQGASQRSRRGSWLAIPVFVVGVGCLIAFLVWNQVQIARVMLFGHSTYATVVAVEQCSRGSAGNLRLTFADTTGHTHTVNHSSYNMSGCVATYYTDETLTIRYVPDDPSVLMTQQEIDNLPVALVFFAIGDVFFIDGGAVLLWLLVLLPTAARLRAALQAG